MRFTQRLVLLLKTLNPDSYAGLCAQLKLGDAVRQFLFTFLFLFALMLLLLVPAAVVDAPLLRSRLASFDSFAVGGNFSAARPVTLVAQPRVVVDLSGNASLDGASVLFSDEGVSWKRWLLFGESSRPWSALTDAKRAPAGTYLFLLLFLAPSIAVWAGLLFLVKDALLVILFGLLAWLLPHLWRVRLSAANGFKLALFAATVMMVVELLLFPFWRTWWLPLLLYAVFLAIGVALVGERDFAMHGRRAERRDAPGRKL